MGLWKTYWNMCTKDMGNYKGIAESEQTVCCNQRSLRATEGRRKQMRGKSKARNEIMHLGWRHYRNNSRLELRWEFNVHGRKDASWFLEYSTFLARINSCDGDEGLIYMHRLNIADRQHHVLINNLCFLVERTLLSFHPLTQEPWESRFLWPFINHCH